MPIPLGGCSKLLALAAVATTASPAWPSTAANWDQSLPVWGVTIQYEAGRTQLGFTQPIDLVVAAGGGIVVLDRSAPFLRMHDANGKTIGGQVRQGGGPGELQQPIRLGWRADSIWAFDASQGRVSLYNQAGKHLGSRPINRMALPGFAGLDPLALLANGGVLVAAWHYGEDNARSTESTTLLAVIDSAGSHAHPIASLTSAHPKLKVKTRTRGAPGEVQTRQPFDDGPLWAAAKDGGRLVIVDRQAPAIGLGATFTITVLTSGGDTIARSPVPYKPIPLSPAIFEKAIAGYLQIRDQGGAPIELDETDLRASVYRPRFVPPAFSLNVGRDSTIWLRTSPQALGKRPAEFSIFDSHGKPLARLSVPWSDHDRLLEADQRHLWVATEADDGVPIIVAYRIVP